MQRFAGIISSTGFDESAFRVALAKSCRNSSESVSLELFPDQHLLVGLVGLPNKASLLWNENHDLCLCWRGDLFPDANDLASFSRSQPAHQEIGAWILSLYDKEGNSGLGKLNGWFSGLIIDLKTRSVTLFNDRYGLGRVYLHEKNGTIQFATEAKTLLALNSGSRALDPRGLTEWLSCGCTLQNRTLFGGINLLPPASAWTFRSGQPEQRQSFFHIDDWAQQSPLRLPDYEDRLQECFPSILQRYLPADRSTAMSLTGGLDGRMIMAWANLPAGNLPCYSFNGPYRECADARLAKRIASACTQPHQNIPITSDFFRNFPKLAHEAISISDGAMDVTGAAELFMNRIAATIAPIRLTGNYGSEILRRHIAFRPAALHSTFFAPELLPWAEAAGQAYRTERGSDSLKFIVSAQLPWHHFSRFSVEESQITVRSPYLDNKLVKLAFQAPISATEVEPSLRLIAAGNSALARIPTDRGVSWPPRAWGNRLYRGYHEFWAKAEYAYDYGMPQWLARLDHALAPLHLERVFLGRQKFCHFRSWYRHELREFVQDVLFSTEAQTRFYLMPARIKQAVESHLKGVANFTTLIHKLLSLELVHRALLRP